MSCEFEKIDCPRCGEQYQIEKRQKQAFCYLKCGIYFNQYGQEEEYDKIRFSSRPLYDSLDKNPSP